MLQSSMQLLLVATGIRPLNPEAATLSCHRAENSTALPACLPVQVVVSWPQSPECACLRTFTSGSHVWPSVEGL